MKVEEMLDYLKQMLEIRDAEFNVDSNIAKWIDSLSALSVIAFADEHFGAKFTAEQIYSIKSVSNLIDLIGRDKFQV